MSDIQSFEPLFGSWYTDGLLGKGSYAKVYRAKRIEYGNTFYSAIKHISIEDGEDYPAEIQANALSREININYELRGEPHFVSYEDSTFINKPDGTGIDVFIRMELLESLTKRMKENPLSEDEIIRMGIEICKALEALEKRGIIHRDIKPANIFVSAEGVYKLGDFGVARSLGGTTSGVTMAGTFNYMAPEIYHGGSVNLTADIYSLGMVLYRLLNEGRGPFLPLPPKSPTYEEANEALARRMRYETLPSPKNGNESLKKVVLKACSSDMALRYSSATAMRGDLELLKRPHIEASEAPAPKSEQNKWIQIRFLLENGTVLSYHSYREGETIQVPDIPKTIWKNNREYHFNRWKPELNTIAKVDTDYRCLYNPAGKMQTASDRRRVPVLLLSVLSAALLIINIAQYVSNASERNNNASITMELAGTKSENQTLSTELAGTKSENETLSTELAGTKSENQTLSTELAGTKSENQTLSKELAGTKSENQTLSKELASTKSELQSLKRNVSAYATRMEKISSQFSASGIPGYASDHFFLDEGLVVLKMGETRMALLTSSWDTDQDIIEILWEPRFGVAVIDSISESWGSEVHMKITPLKIGTEIITFSNSYNSETFQLIVIVTQ